MTRILPTIFLPAIMLVGQTFAQTPQFMQVVPDRKVISWGDSITFTVYGGTPPYNWYGNDGSFVFASGDTFTLKRAFAGNVCVNVNDKNFYAGSACVVSVRAAAPFMFYSNINMLNQEVDTGVFTVNVGWLSLDGFRTFISVRNPATLVEQLFSSSTNNVQNAAWIVRGYNYRFSQWIGNPQTWTGQEDGDHWRVSEVTVPGPQKLVCSPALQITHGGASFSATGGDPNSYRWDVIGAGDPARGTGPAFNTNYPTLSNDKDWQVNVQSAGMNATCMVHVPALGH